MAHVVFPLLQFEKPSPFRSTQALMLLPSGAKQNFRILFSLFLKGKHFLTNFTHSDLQFPLQCLTF